MLQPNDDLFACGVHAPRGGTVCDIALIDDAIILGIIAAATIASSQISAKETERNQNKLLDDQQKQQMKQTQLGWLQQRGQNAMAGVAARHGGHGGGASMTDSNTPWIQKDAIDNHYEVGRQANARQADQTRTDGYIHAGMAVAQGIGGAALGSAAGSGSDFVSGAGYAGTGAGIAERAAGYDLPQETSSISPVQTAPLHAADPMGGFQLQPGDYATLGGAGAYSAGPFADDEFATASPYQNPNRYRFGI